MFNLEGSLLLFNYGLSDPPRLIDLPGLPDLVMVDRVLRGQKLRPSGGASNPRAV